MAELTLLASNGVRPQVGLTGSADLKTAGEALSENDALFIVTDSGTGTVGTVMKLNNSSQEESTFYGFALNDCANGAAVYVVRSGEFYMDGITFGKGQVYVASSTAGNLELISDVVAGEHVSIVGASYDEDKFVIAPKYIGIKAV